MAAVSAALGQPFMPWQQHVADVALEVLPDGRWAYRTVVITVPRQAGKTTLVKAVLCHRGQLLERGSLWLTAQNRDKARKRWLDATDHLTQRLPSTFKRNVGNSHEVLRWLKTGSQLFPFAPNADVMHGESPDLVAPDEIWAFTAQEAAELQQAYLPGMITKNAQELITSTQGTDESEWLNELTGSGRATVELQQVDESRRRGVAYFEWSIPREVDSVPVEQLDDARLLDVICAHHPAFGLTIGREDLEFHLDRFRSDREGYIRGYGNLRLGSNRPRVIPEAQWRAAAHGPAVPDPVGLGVVVDEDGQHAAVVAAGRGSDGRAVVEVVQAADGWWLDLDGRLVAPAEFVRHVAKTVRAASVCVLTAGANRDLADALEAVDVPGLVKVPAADYAAACARLRQGFAELTVQHRGQPSLDAAAKAVQLRKVAGGLGFVAPSADEPVTALDAAALALWAADHPVEVRGRFRVF